MTRYSSVITKLIAGLNRLPGIGTKSAQRLAFHILSMPKEEALELAEAIVNAKEKIVLCSLCCNLTEKNPCEYCSSPQRDSSVICVVDNPRDVAAMERINEYKGLYHVLHGAINPMKGIGPSDIKLKELLSRLREDTQIDEVILANNPSVEGEATAMYIARLVKPANIKVTRIAHGLPMGSDIEYADEITLAKALEGRREL